ncbi:SHOCT-like domain-containing protein [Dehalogenimonas etheniformans]|uniref:YvlB/LiaX N-terminal domain-containing protein n=1 Tax=Dehalogenimonas etheniformans TaxID=1536648 RepID=A0A2P5P8D4_9CHLR|nr:hypothetical protein [Dehalogenimonas etheniformans]PPD58546.1 hypothetical protein JP09_001275 [Dehalogenimonas etheniformans]QNT76690.1 hypothetical protein HX448_08345 [Dehalogenimonas etheniformans]
MSDNRKKILEMLDAKKITVDEATKLLSAVDRGGSSFSDEKPIDQILNRVGRKIKYLRVLIDNPHSHHGETPEKVNVRVPVSLIRAGMKFTSLIPREAGDKVEEELRCRGINLNIKNIKDEDIDDLIEALSELEVDIDGGEGKVRVFAE